MTRVNPNSIYAMGKATALSACGNVPQVALYGGSVRWNSFAEVVCGYLEYISGPWMDGVQKMILFLWGAFGTLRGTAFWLTDNLFLSKI